MTTRTTVSIIDHTSDAGFRAWVAEDIAEIIASGMVQTSDTGQINTATVTRPAINTDGGYAIFRMNDTQQGAAPVFFKKFYGTGGVATRPRMRMQVGTASNGSGTVSGLGSVNTDDCSVVGTILSTVTTYTSRYCCEDGVFWWAWKISASVADLPWSVYAIHRLTDDDGVPIDDGIVQVWATSATVCFARTISYANSIIYGSADEDTWLLFIYAQTSTLVGADPQSFLSYCWTPRGRIMPQLIGILDAECARGVQLTATPIGTTPRNYINAFPISTAGRAAALIWE